VEIKQEYGQSHSVIAKKVKERHIQADIQPYCNMGGTFRIAIEQFRIRGHRRHL